MIATTVPAEARLVADNIRDLFPDLRYKSLCAVICLFLLGKHTLYRGVREMTFAPSVSTMSRAVRKIKPNRLMRRMRKSLAKKFKNTDPKDLVFVLDDTANPKYTKAIHRSDYWGGSSGIFLGQKIMVLAVVHVKTKKVYPVGFTILPKRESKKAPTAHWHANRLASEAIAAGIRAQTFVADSWFDSTALMANLEAQGIDVVVQIKSNRKVRSNPGKYVKWSDLESEFLGETRKRSRTEWESEKIRSGKKRGICLAEKVLQIRGRSCPLKVVAAYKRRNGVEVFRYYASTNRTMSRSRIWAVSRMRWKIEELFRTCKQRLAFGKLSCKGKDAAHLAVALPLFLYRWLTEKCPKTMQIDRYIASIVTESNRKGIFSLTSSIDRRPAEIARNRLATNRTHQKPRDSAAGESKMVG